MELLIIPDDDNTQAEERKKRVSVKNTSRTKQLGSVLLFAMRMILLGYAIFALLRKQICEQLVNQAQAAALLAISAVNCVFHFVSTVYSIQYKNYTTFIALVVGLVLQEAITVIFQRQSCALREFRCYCWVNWATVVCMLLLELWRIVAEPSAQVCDL